MKRIINVITLLDLLFLFLFLLSSMTSGSISSDILYYGAFIAPSFIGVLYIRGHKPISENEKTVSLSLNKEALPYLSFVIPLTLLVSLFAMATSAITSALGLSSEVNLGDNLLLALLLHALLPTLFEEFLFRFIPLKLLLPYSRRLAIIISSLYFGLLHLDIAKLPYALFAGLIFSLIDVAAQSIIPSMIMHFLNNTLSVLLIFYPDGIGLAVIISVSALLLLLSAVLAVPNRRLLSGITEPLFEKDTEKRLPAAVFLLIFAALFIAITNLLL